MSIENDEKRGHHRFFFPQFINYGLQSQFAVVKEDIFRGITVNISNTGLCLYVFHRLNKGEKLTVPKDIIKKPYYAADVCWVKKVERGIYKVVLKFVHENETSVQKL